MLLRIHPQHRPLRMVRPHITYLIQCRQWRVRIHLLRRRVRMIPKILPAPVIPPPLIHEHKLIPCPHPARHPLPRMRCPRILHQWPARQIEHDPRYRAPKHHKNRRSFFFCAMRTLAVSAPLLFIVYRNDQASSIIEPIAAPRKNKRTRLTALREHQPGEGERAN